MLLDAGGEMAQSLTIENWSPPAGEIALDAREVHVWMSSIDLPSATIAALATWLSGDECDRAARFRHDRHRNRFIAGRAMMRGILARYIDEEPAKIEFDYLSHGKPQIASSKSALEFNLSHSGDVALLAVTLHDPIGVDVEHIRGLRDMQGLADRFFSASEAAQIACENGDRQLNSFFRCWTRKEAYVKAIGEGITCALDSFEVSIAAESPAQLVHINQDASIAADWSMVSIVPQAQYVGALATAAPIQKLESWIWDAESIASK